jgi:hypothetical protein
METSVRKTRQNKVDRERIKLMATILEIELNINSPIILVHACDGANLIYNAFIINGNNKLVARVYKSFSKEFKPIHQIRYCYID